MAAEAPSYIVYAVVQLFTAGMPLVIAKQIQLDRTAARNQIDCPDTYCPDGFIPAVPLFKEYLRGLRNLQRALRRKGDWDLVLLEPQTACADLKLYRLCRQSMKAQSAADILGQFKDHLPYIVVAGEVTAAGNAVANGFHGRLVFRVHDAGAVQSVGIALQDDAVLAEPLLHVLNREVCDVTDGVHISARQLPAGRSAHEEQVRRWERPDAFTPVVLLQNSDGIGLFHVRAELGEDLVERYTDGYCKADFLLYGLADLFSNLLT